jgi:tricorn protease-like protein
MMNNPGSAKAGKTLEKLISLAGSTSSDTLSENRIFFVAPKAAKN